jgi:hypothetical protein
MRRFQGCLGATAGPRGTRVGGPELLAATEDWGGGPPTEIWYQSGPVPCPGCDAWESILMMRFDATSRLLLLTGRYVQE